MTARFDTDALSAALAAFEQSLSSGAEQGTGADSYRQAEKGAYFAVDLAALTELGARESEQDFSQQFAVALADVLQNPDAAIDAGETLKHDRTTTVAKIQVRGISLVIKRYNRKSLLHGFTRLWRTTRARRSFDAARWLLQHGILTAMPLAFIENRSFGALNHGAYYLSLCHPGENLLRQLNSGDIKNHDFDALLSEFGRLFTLLRRANAAHGDMKISNFHLPQQQAVRSWTWTRHSPISAYGRRDARFAKMSQGLSATGLGRSLRELWRNFWKKFEK